MCELTLGQPRLPFTPNFLARSANFFGEGRTWKKDHGFGARTGMGTTRTNPES